MPIYIIAALVAYLLGSIPFGLILVRLFKGADIRATGSGNIGAANVARFAPGLGALTLLLDAAKGYAAIFTVRFLAGQPASGLAVPRGDLALILGIAGLFAVLGHMFPVWLRFKGGKGVATAMGVYLGIVPMAVLITVVLFIIIFALWHYSSLASITATVIFPLAVYFAMARQERRQLLPSVVIVAVLIIAKHRQNIQRLQAGTEHRFELKKSKTSDAAQHGMQ